MRRFGPPYPTNDWDARLTIGELCSSDDPRGMLAWAALNYDPGKHDEQDIDDQLAGLFVEIYARVTEIESGLPSAGEDVTRLRDDLARASEIVAAATGVASARRSA